jgi:DNA invertase Pin-like site-specific DNA recombinase
MATHEATIRPFPAQGRIALYARVSTNHGQDPELQVRELREYVASRGWTIIEEYIDLGVSGAKSSRPALNRLMTDAHRRRFDGILVWKLDRFGRSLRHLVNAIAELEAPGSGFRQPAGQSRPEHALRAAHVSDHRRHGRV